MSFRLRKACKSDLILIFNWANEKSVIKNSINRVGKLNINDHENWYKKYQGSKLNFIYIFSKNKKDIGLVRLDLVKNFYFISYLIDKKFRNKGLGYIMLKKFVNLFHKKKKIKNFYAKVKNKNISSIKIFEKLGFKRYYISNIKRISYYKLIKNNV